MAVRHNDFRRRQTASHFGRGALICALLASTSLAYGQDTTSDGVTLLERLVVTAAGGTVDMRTAPASISVISSEQLEQSSGKTLEQLLATIPGVNVSHSGNLQFVQIRGLPNKYSLFLVDGKRVNSDPNVFRGNDFDAGWIPLASIERIEVVRGPMSSLYGSDAIGGVVNIITKKSDGTLHGSITQEVTIQENRKSGDYFRTSGYLAGPIVPDVLSFRLSAAWDHRNADASDVNAPYTDWSGKFLPGFLESENRNVDANLQWTPDNQNTVDVDYSYAYRVHDTIPLERNALSVTHTGSYDFGDTELRLSADRIYNHQGNNNAVEYEPNPNTAYNVSVDGRVVFPWDVFLDQTITLGGAFNYQMIEDSFTLGGDGTSDIWQAAVFVEDRLQLTDQLSLTLGNRTDYHAEFGLHNSPKAFLVYELSDNLTIKTGVSTSFKAPTLLQSSANWTNLSCGGSCYVAGSPSMEPETGISGEFGLNYDDGTWQWGLTYFRNEIDNVIVSSPNRTGDIAEGSTYFNYVGLNADGKPIYRYYNSDSLSSQGIEANVQFRPTDDWTITAGYTYVNSTTTNAGVDGPTLYQPTHVANVGVIWQATEQLQLGADVSLVSQQVTSINTSTGVTTATAPGYGELNLTAKYDVNENFSLSGGVLNVFDNQVLRETSSGFNVDGRRYYMSATAKF